VDIKNQDSVARLNNLSVNYASKDCSFGSCTFKYNLATSGTFSFTAYADSLTDYRASVQGQTEVKDPYVKPDFTNMESLECVQPNIPITITFQTKNPQGELITSSNLIKVYKPIGSESINLDCPTGECSFDYTFSIEGGHKVGLISSSPGYTSYPEVQSPYVYVKSDCTPPECTKKEDCISPKTCVNYKCTDVCNSWTCQPWFYFVLIIGGIGVVILIILLVLILRRKKPESTLL